MRFRNDVVYGIKGKTVMELELFQWHGAPRYISRVYSSDTGTWVEFNPPKLEIATELLFISRGNLYYGTTGNKVQGFTLEDIQNGDYDIEVLTGKIQKRPTY